MIVIGLLIMVPVAMAADTPVVSVSTDQEWLTAGSSDYGRVTATVTDSGGAPLKGVNVRFSCDDGTSSFSPREQKTRSDGTAVVLFRQGTCSGEAVITASVSMDDDARVFQAECVQRIDHAAPCRMSVQAYESEVTAGGTTEITLQITDRFGNTVDPERETEYIHFFTGSPSGEAGICDGGSCLDDVLLPIGADGRVTAVLRTDPVVGENIVLIMPPAPVLSRYCIVYGIGNGVPASISASVTPDSSVPADGISAISITFRLCDRFGNPSCGRDIRISALPGEEQTLASNSDGTVTLTYGPKQTAGTVDLVVAAVDNASVSLTVPLQFTNRDPVDMILSASPQCMPALEVNPGAHSEVRAKVIDEKGNPVAGQRVDFSITDPVGSAMTVAPALSGSSALTDADGYASVRFVPGAFPGPGDAGYDPASVATCTVRAVWEGVNREIDMNWMNYPYLSVVTSVDPETVRVNDTVDVTVTLRGDGWALQSDPIDVVLAIDRSGSMNDPILPASTKMDAAKNAALAFVCQMNSNQDRIGVVPYFTTSAPVAVSLSSEYAGVCDAIEGLSPGGWTPTRLALKNAIDDLVLHPNENPDAVRAVILLSDGQYNYFGDPLARGNASDAVYNDTGTDDDCYRWYGYCGGAASSPLYDFTSLPDQNLASYAASHGVRIYCISFGDGIAAGDTTYDTMSVCAESTGGFHEHAPDAAALSEIYARIAGELKDIAGVDASMTVSLSRVSVNDAIVDGAGVLDYVPIDGRSTLLRSWMEGESVTVEIEAPHTVDQSADWADDRTLQFDIGTVHLNQVWTASYTLKVGCSGNINLFGPGSLLSFNNGSDTLALPDTYVTAVADLNNAGLGAAALDLENLRTESGGADTLHVQWDLGYNGSAAATQRISYSTDDRQTWTLSGTLPPLSAGEYAQETFLDMNGAAGGYYWVRVRATAPDAPDAVGEIAVPVGPGMSGGPKIRLE
ncbi:Ig-like domain-containing protein [Methanofollis fontis]|nr:Ig-like domain-containing protein [Methanofollis fontis]